MGVCSPLTRPRSVSREAVRVAGLNTPANCFDCRFDLVEDGNACRIWSGDDKLIFAGDLRLEDGHAAPRELLRPSGYTNRSDGAVINLYGPDRAMSGSEKHRYSKPQLSMHIRQIRIAGFKPFTTFDLASVAVFDDFVVRFSALYLLTPAT